MTLSDPRKLLLGALALGVAACSPQAADPEADNSPDTTAGVAPAPETATTIPEETAMNAGAVIDDYLPWDASSDLVERTESGLEYIILKEGAEGGLAPTSARDQVTVMYEGRLARNGEKFDSSYDRGSPASFPLNGVISGWTEGLQLMSVGDEYLFYIPAALGYGENPRPGGLIQPGDDLVFKVDLRDVVPAPKPRPVSTEAWETYTPWDESREDIVSTDSGLQYVVIESGDASGPSPEGDDQVAVFYEGRLDETGMVFDSAFQRGEAAVFPANRLIPGWVEALQLMRPGDRWLIHIPSKLGYGERGTPGGPIPPGADLNFEVELMDVLARQ